MLHTYISAFLYIVIHNVSCVCLLLSPDEIEKLSRGALSGTVDSFEYYEKSTVCQRPISQTVK